MIVNVLVLNRPRCAIWGRYLKGVKGATIELSWFGDF